MKAVALACLIGVLACTTATSSRLAYLTRHDANNQGTVGGRNTIIERLQGIKHRSIQHHSLIPPHLQGLVGVGIDHSSHVFPPSSGGMAEVVPFWGWEETTGSTVLTDDYVRLTPNDGSRHGALWNLEPISDIPAFELMVGFKIHSPHTLGADGMAIWIADRIPNDKEPRPWFGMVKEMRGLGILLDSYDNDGAKDNPRISLVYKKEVNPSNAHEWDTGKDFKGAALGSCQVDFRNKKDLTAVILRYRPGGNIELVVATNDMANEQPCVNIEASDIAFPQYDIVQDGNSNPHRVADSPAVVEAQRHNSRSGYHIGVTAATGGVSDNHDVYFVALFPITGYSYDHDVHKLPENLGDHHDENGLHYDEQEGRTTKRFSHSKDKQDREYWRQKNPEEQQAARELEMREHQEKQEAERREAGRREAERREVAAKEAQRAAEERQRQQEADRVQRERLSQQPLAQPPAQQFQQPSVQQPLEAPVQQQYQQQPPVQQYQQQPPVQPYQQQPPVQQYQQQPPVQQHQQQPPIQPQAPVQQQYQQQPPVQPYQQQPPVQQYQQQPPVHQYQQQPPVQQYQQQPPIQPQAPVQQQYQQQPPVQQYQPPVQQYQQQPPVQHQQPAESSPQQHQAQQQHHPHQARHDPYNNAYQ